MSTAKLVAVVEDDAAIRDNYLAGLRRQGYRVAGFGSRKEALAAFANRFPDLVIIDVNLGAEVEGGFELCRELRAQSAQLPIISPIPAKSRTFSRRYSASALNNSIRRSAARR